MKKAKIEREKEWPHFWVARDDDGKRLDRDQYQNDLIPRLEGKGYVVEKIGQ